MQDDRTQDGMQKPEQMLRFILEEKKFQVHPCVPSRFGIQASLVLHGGPRELRNPGRCE